MKFGMAIPTPLLKALTPLCDYDFVLAHMLQDKAYREFYSTKRPGRMVLLDNGYFERNESMSAAELVDACKQIEPDFVVCPDRLGDAAFTYKGFVDMKRMMPPSLKTRLAVCIQGSDATDRVQLFENVRRHASMICFPFRENRASWFVDIAERIPAYMPIPPYIHLLGVSSLAELKEWRDILHRYSVPHHRVSVDTTKPIKFGLQGKLMDDTMELRGHGGWPTEPVKDKVSDQQLAAMYYNVAFLRKSL